MPVSGNAEARLKQLLKQVGKLAGPSLRLELSKNLAAEARTQVMNEFKEQHDPYGEKWPATLRGGQILADTGRLRNSIKPVATSSGFNVRTTVKYASMHNYGGVVKAKAGKYLVFKVGGRWVSKKEVHIPKRQFFPDKDRGLGRIWAVAFERVAVAWLLSKLNKRAA